MKLPITEQDLQKFETKIKNESGKSVSEISREHARIITNLINAAYLQGFNDAQKKVEV